MTARTARYGWAFLAPFLCLFALFFVAPIGYAGWQSLHQVRRSGLGFGGSAEVVFTGLDNYGAVLQDSAFRSALLRVVVFALIQIPVMLAVATLLAVILDSGLVWLKRLFRITIVLPYGVPAVVAALMWTNLYAPQLSPLNDLLRSDQPNLLSERWIMVAIGNVATWEFMGYFMLVLVTTLQAVPRSISEAAQVDGAGPLRIALFVKLPLLRPSLIMAITFSIIGALQLFNEPAVLRSASTAISADFTPNMYAFATTFNGAQPYLGAAQAVALAAITFALSIVFMRGTRRWSEA